MIRLLLRLLKIRDFEPCKSCETYKELLAFERDEKRRLTETLLNIFQPKVEEAPKNPIILNNAGPTGMLFSRKRAFLEERDRIEADIKNKSTILGKPDDKLKAIENLEKELGVDEKEA